MSHVRYCSQVFGCANKTTLKRLQKVQNFAARIVSGRRKYQSVSDVIEDLEWLPISTMLEYHDMCLLHKINRTNEPEILRREVTFNRVQCR